MNRMQGDAGFLLLSGAVIRKSNAQDRELVMLERERA